MNNAPALIALGAGAVVLLWPQISAALTLPLPTRTTTGVVPPQTGINPYALPPPTITPNRPGATSFPVPAVIGGTATAFGTALGLTAATIAGIAAAGGIVAWGIIAKGWFRGGEEAMYVNPARDDFKALFAHLNPYVTADHNGPGFYGLAWLLHELGRDDLMQAFMRANVRRTWEMVVSEIEAVIATNADTVAYLVEYARTAPKV